ncbi:transcription factor [Datura stramonium]|uniref:Transcription factor n=1 Tax=Datura stramonium TaxID=4076 RepID=A0ABS8TJP6_DATST|nr:transcription factor [Datura stramonium]
MESGLFRFIGAIGRTLGLASILGSFALFLQFALGGLVLSRGGYIEGDIKISGYSKKQDTFARISGYCEQNDICSPYVTVYESLVYSAWLRLPHHVDKKSRKMFVEEAMDLVVLGPLRLGLVGLPGANASKGAAIVMRTVRNTVDTGRTYACRIHQPSIDIFEAFDELFLMKRGAQEIYIGALGLHSYQLIKYFESIPGVSKIKDGYNPATWMLEVTISAQGNAVWG